MPARAGAMTSNDTKSPACEGKEVTILWCGPWNGWDWAAPTGELPSAGVTAAPAAAAAPARRNPRRLIAAASPSPASGETGPPPSGNSS